MVQVGAVEESFRWCAHRCTTIKKSFSSMMVNMLGP